MGGESGKRSEAPGVPQAYRTVRRGDRREKIAQMRCYRLPQQRVGEKCGLGPRDRPVASRHAGWGGMGTDPGPGSPAGVWPPE